MRRIVLILAALAWLGGAVSLLAKGGSLLMSAHELLGPGPWPGVAMALGLAVGVAKARFMMSPSSKRNIARIRALPRPRPWNFFSGKFFVALSVMIAVGVTSSRLAGGDPFWLCVVGCVDISLGVGLLLSARHYAVLRRAGGQPGGQPT